MTFKSVPQRRANWHDPQWTKGSVNQPYVSRKVLEANRLKMQELIHRAQSGEVKPIVLPLGQYSIEEAS